MKIKTFVTTNNIHMVYCRPYNWRIENKYVDRSDEKYLCIHIGDMEEMYSCILEVETMILSITKMSFGGNDVFKFKVTTIEQATNLVECFVLGMNKKDCMLDTIFTDIPDNFLIKEESM